MSVDLTLNDLIKELDIPDKYAWIFRLAYIREMDMLLEIAGELCSDYYIPSEIIEYIRKATESFLELLNAISVDDIDTFKKSVKYWWLLTREIDILHDDLVDKIKKYF